MSDVSPFAATLIAWVVVTVVFVGLLIVRTFIGMREDDQLFLNPTESKMEAEQKQILGRLNRLAPYTKGFGFASAGLLAVVIGLWVHRGLTEFSSTTMP